MIDRSEWVGLWDVVAPITLQEAAGALGTAGAAMLCQQREFLDDPVVRSGDPFEAVCSVDIAGGAPERSKRS
ncbi:hypothetical protein [Nocardia tengchongensis]|uniref:hypothetical protein n=1 Tax=Nocardia tengchongensis TaxID=2055889 RepID=UPI0036A5859E